MPIQVDHIRDVSFQNHFLASGGNGPVNGRIQVNHNTFDVSFDNGRVSARFASGNWFTNLFRGGTMTRFTQTLQTQYDSWVQEKSKASAAQAGFTDNANVPGVKTAVDECFDILHASAHKLDNDTLNCSKDVLKAYGTMHEVNGEIQVSQTLDDHDADNFEHYCEVMPKNIGKYAQRLGQFADLAAIRNQLTTVATGSEIDSILLNRYGLKSHMASNCEGQSEIVKKKYLLNIIDTLLDGFLNAVNAMKDKNTELIAFLDKFDGVCIEAKSDNIQAWLGRATGAVKEVRSTEKNDLAYSVTAEFNVLADEVKAPFRAAARKECEAQVREECKNANIVDEVEIEQRIKERVETIIMQKSEEIDPLIHQKIESDGKFALYDNLVGANRPFTIITKNEETGMWKVTTLVDKENKPVLKPVSAFDIDKRFKQLVDMYKDDAVSMGMVEYETLTAVPKTGNRNDLFAKDVIGEATDTLKDDNEVKKFCQRVKGQMRIELDIPDAEFETAVRRALQDVIDLKTNSSEETERNFSRFVNNYIDSSYADQLSDTGRLANIVARRVENIKAFDQSFLADLDGKAGRCAQMLKSAYPDMIVDVKKAQEAIAKTLSIMVERIQTNPANSKSCKSNLAKIMYNGRLFTDEMAYDMSHRAAGAKESMLHKKLNTLMQCIEYYGQIDRATFIRENGQGVQA